MRILGRILLVVALLVAQTAGMAHELWHASTLAADSDGDAPAIDAVAPPQTAFIAADVPAARLSPLAPRSRAPPSLL